MIKVIIRVLLTLALIYGVYTETGVWTAISFFLLFLGMEANSYTIKRMNQM